MDVIFSHRNPISPTTDMDPFITLSDGISSVGFVVFDKSNFGNHAPITAVEGLSGPKMHSPSIIPGHLRVTSEPATVHTLHFRLESQRPAEGFGHASYGSEISVYHQYSRILHPERGLSIEVYRENDLPEQYIFSFFKIRGQVESLF